MLDGKRRALLDKMVMAFQPIVYKNGESCFGLEALVANVQMLEYASVADLLDEVERESFLFPFVVEMIKLVLKKASSIPSELRPNLFINIDNRIFSHPEVLWAAEMDESEKFNLKGTSICFEISEQNRFSYAQLKRCQEVWFQKGIQLAIDDFGTGISGLELLYHSNPDFLKIDRFFIRDINSDQKKQTILKSILGLCDSLDIETIAEGVETAEEKDYLLESGIDLFQGFYFQRPVVDIKELIRKWKS